MTEPVFSFIIPTRGRPESLLRLFDSIRTHTGRLDELEVVLVTDDDDQATRQLDLSGPKIRIVEGTPGRSMGALNAAGYRAATGRYIALLNDDVVIRTPSWDDQVTEVFHAHPDGIVLVHVNDAIFRESLCTFPFVTRTFCELAGGICPEGYLRYRIDDHIHSVFDLLTALGHRRRVFLPGVVFQHLNLSKTSKGFAYVVDPAIHAVDSRLFDALMPERKRLVLAAAGLIEGHEYSQLRGFHESKLDTLHDSEALRLSTRPRWWGPSHGQTSPCHELALQGNPVNLVSVSDSVFERNVRLRAHLLQTIRRHASPSFRVTMDEALGITTAATAPTHPDAPIDVVISHGEINNEHGTGVLVKRAFRGRRGIFSIRFREDWGIHDFGDWHVRLPLKPYFYSEIRQEVRRLLEGRNVKTVTCVPFTAGELLAALAVNELFDARLCIWIMDDQNIAADSIPDAIMKESLENCALRLTTHAELRDAYQDKYALAIHILPAVVPAHLIRVHTSESNGDRNTTNAALLGSFWEQSWFDGLCSVLEHCGCSTDWYGQNRSPWVKFPLEDLARARIRPFGIVPEDRLAPELRKYPFVIVPAGARDGTDPYSDARSLSLPGRILFAAATSHTPILVVGGDQSCAARFVRHFGIGTAAPYDARAVAAAMDHLRQPRVQAEMRRNAADIASMFSDNGVVDWLAASIQRGAPADGRFEKAFSHYDLPIPYERAYSRWAACACSGSVFDRLSP